ncbi:MAG: suppressor of fused domain protein [Clostridiales Family XIII bacterium]|jgi:hypothetical protein|nr:suppressor of fused domain protein [Clostridiales Family XIII bacterium]
MGIPTERHIKLAKFVSGAIGFVPSVSSYSDETNTHSINILTVTDPLDPDVRFYSTIGLSDYENRIEMEAGAPKNIPIELIMAGYQRYRDVPNILATCAFYLIKNERTCSPDDIWKDIAAMYYKKGDMKHVLFTPPFLWGDKLGGGFELPGQHVEFLFGASISDRELAYKAENGFEKLSELLEKKNVNMFDMERASII